MTSRPLEKASGSPVALPSETEVLVVGGGFAGLTAARELGRAGVRVVLLEARDRLGGRTWTTSVQGSEVELGGAYVHWYQPHLWSELTRYGLGIQSGREPETAAWLSEGRRRDTSAEQLAALLGEGMAAACHDAAELMPVPFEIRAEASGADRLSVAERLDRTGLRAEVRDLLRGGLGTLSSAPLAEAGYVPTALKAFALASSDAGVFLEQNASHTIRGGTRALVEAMAADARADVALSTDVVSVRRSADAVTLTANGTQMRARAAVMAVPLNALRRIDFDPPLSAAKRRVAWAGQASRGAKLFLRIRGHHAPLMILAPEEHHLTLLEWAGTIEDDTLLVGFASTNRVLSDRGLLGRAVADLLPGAEVLDVLAHDWTSDPLAGGTWCTLRPGQFTGALQELRRSEGRLVFAGGDIAAGWLGYIDGAIETGLSAARQVRALLS